MASALRGAPGAYDDNDGAYLVRIGVNERPTVPEPASLLIALMAAGCVSMHKRFGR